MQRVLQRLLEPPRFEDADRTRAAYVLHWILTAGAVAVGFQFVLATLFFMEPAASFALNGPLLAFIVISIALLRRGWVATAALLVSVATWLTITAQIVYRGGVIPNSLPGYVITIMLVGLVAGARAAGVVAAASSAVVALVAYGVVELVPPMAPPSAGQLTVAFVSMAFVAAVLVWLADRAVQNAMSETRRSERRWAQLVESAPVGVIVLDRSATISRANPAAARLYGALSAELLIGARIDASPFWTANRGDAMLAACFERGESFDFEVSGQTAPLGAPLRIRAHVTPLRDPDGSITDCMILFEDVTKQRELEEQLAQSHKLEALGRLAGGISHDFNNLLTVVSGFSEAAYLELDDRPEVKKYLKQVMNAAKRAAGLTRQLLAFSRKQVIQPAIFDLNETLSSLEEMLGRLIGEDVDLAVEIAPDPLQVEADEGQIEQVILNLVVNARDAMPDGGHLSVRTRLEPRNDAGHRKVVLSVQDSGVGMSSETLQRIFDPFFTTKPSGQGTGLGLATAYGIVQQAGGELRVSSEEGRGSLFEVLLPWKGEQRLPQATEPGPEAVPALLGGSVLIVEDEPGVRQILQAMFDGAGFSTRVASDGVEALELMEREGAVIDLLVTDVVMRRLGGVELCERLREARPNLPVLFVSGYADHPRLEGYALPEGTAFLSKPFDASDLFEAVRSLLEQRGGRTAAL